MKRISMWLFLLIISSASFCWSAEYKKVFHLCSYHKELPWSAGIITGMNSVLKDHPEIRLKTFYMDTKRNADEEFKKSVALRAKQVIEQWQPDVIITSDDNAAKYVIVPYFKNSKIPVVFCGINWSAEEYGFPCSNVTGMIEVQMVDQIIKYLKPYAKGGRIAFLKGDDFSARKEADFFEKTFKITLDKRFVNNFSQWSVEFRKIQDEADMLLLGNPASISGWNPHIAQKIINERVKIPIGNWEAHMAPYSLITLATIPEEQGEWVAHTALAILSGRSPTEIPPVRNKRARIILNMKQAQLLGVRFPGPLMEVSSFVSAKKPKIFYVNSYHKGYRWSDNLEKGLFKALQVEEKNEGEFDLSVSKVDFKLLRLDTKLHTSEEFKRRVALEAQRTIDSWKPDVLIVSDDNAVKYLVVPYYRNKTIPVVFCGVNGDASPYNLPPNHITGMVEVEPIEQTIKLMQSVSSGKRLGYLGVDNLSINNQLKKIEERISFTDGSLIKTFSQWQQEYLRLQKSVDMLLLFSPIGLKGWDEQRAKAFIFKNTKIPSGTTNIAATDFALLGRLKIAEEFGWWAGKSAVRIIDGEALTNIPTTTNTKSKVYLNMALAKQLGIIFPVQVLKEANLLDQGGIN